MNPKIYIIGHGRHGKDTFASIFCDLTGAAFVSSSEFAGRRAVWPHFEGEYPDFEACFKDRHSRRMEWRELIADYNKTDPLRLSREIFSEYDVYVGIRRRAEFLAAKEEGLFDMAVWVDASKRITEVDGSLDIEVGDCQWLVDNNKGLENLQIEATHVAQYWKELRDERNQIQ